MPIVLCAIAGCPKPAPRPGPQPPAFDAGPQQTKCAVVKSGSEPLIVEWPSAERTKLESFAGKGLVAIRQEGCAVKVLARCPLGGRYAYTPTTTKRDLVTVTSEDELYANLPVGAAKLEGKLASSGQLNVSMTIVGRFDADRAVVTKPTGVPECEGATHYVTGFTSGAFRFYSGSTAAIAAGAAAFGAGVGGKTEGSSETLTADGDDVACTRSTATDARPPFGCGAILRIELVPLGEAKAAAPSCPPGTAWDGSQCATRCPVGTKLVEGACRPEVVTTASTSGAPPPETEGDETARAALAPLVEKLKADWGTPDAPRFRFEGDPQAVVEQLHARASMRRAYLDALDAIVKTHRPKRLLADVHVRAAMVNDTFLSAVRAAKADGLDAASEKKLAALEVKARKTLSSPSASAGDRAAAKEMLAKVEAIRDKAAGPWLELRSSYEAALEPELVDRYVRGILRARQFGIDDPTLRRLAWERMGDATKRLGDAKIAAHLTGVEKDIPPWTYTSGAFLAPFGE